MSDRKDFNLGDYVEVKDRIKIFYELYGQGRLVTTDVRATTEPDGKPRIWVQASAFRTADDPLPGIGWSWIELPGSTPYTKGSELENAETSAWGRAIGALGILIDRSIASANEVRNKEEDKPAVREPGPGNSGLPTAQQDRSKETLRALGPIVREGAVAKGTGQHTDLEWRQAPDGWRIGFLLEVGGGKERPQVIVAGPLALTLFEATNMGTVSLEGQKVTVEGEVFEVRNPPRKATHRIIVSRLWTPDFVIPPDEPPAETVPAFTPEELADIPELVG